MTRPPDDWSAPAPLGLAAGARRGGHARLVAICWLAVALAATAFIGVAVPRTPSADAERMLSVPANRADEVLVSAAVGTPPPAATGSVGTAAEKVLAEPAAGSIRVSRSHVEFYLRDADVAQVLPHLAALTGANISGLETLSGTNARLTLRGSFALGLESWKAVLEDLNFLLSCSGRSCDVWILSGSAHAEGAKGGVSAPVSTRVASVESVEVTAAQDSLLPSIAPVRTMPVVASSEDAAEN